MVEEQDAQYWKLYAEQLLMGLMPNSVLKNLTTNTALLGSYAEASVHSLVFKTVAPLRVSTGSLISPSLAIPSAPMMQLDIIVWEPHPLPAIFDQGEFALVPPASVAGVLEVKRSAYGGAGAAMTKTLDWVESTVPGAQKLFSGEIEPRKFSAGVVADPNHKALGVVCIRENGNKDRELDQLVEKGRAVVLIDQNNAGELTVNPSHVAHLLMFLQLCRYRFAGGPGEGNDPRFIAMGPGMKPAGYLSKKPQKVEIKRWQ